MVKPGSLLFLRFCIQYSSIAWLYYDYALTWAREVRYIWTAKLRYTTALYIFCRYGLIANVVYALALSKQVPNVRQAVNACKALGVLGRVSVLSIWTIRTWAVWERSRWILVLLCPLVALCTICDIVGATPVGTPRVDAAMAIGTVAHEWLATILTTWRCLRTLRDPDMSHLPKDGLYRQIMNQGLLYFCVVSSLSLTQTVLHYHGPITSEGDFFKHLLSAFVLPVSGFFTARFILNMREISERRTTGPHNDKMPNFTNDTFGPGSVVLSRLEFRESEVGDGDSGEDDEITLGSEAGPSHSGEV